MKIIKLSKTEDIAEVIQIIKELKDKELVFAVPKGSVLLNNSNNFRIMRKSAEALGKTLKVRSDDKMAQLLAMKADVLEGKSAASKPIMPVPKVKRSDVKPRFGDIMRRPAAIKPHPASRPVSVPRVRREESPKPTTPYIQHAEEELSFREPKSRKKSFAKYFVLVMVVLVIVVFGLAVLLPTANITVYARSETISRDMEINVDKAVPAANADSMSVPGSVVTREVSVTKNYPTTGIKAVGTKATGSITLYNFTKNTLTLKASTTALVVNGKRFLFTKDVTGLKPTQLKNGNPDPASLIPPIAIVAEQPGEDYNLPANTKFSVVNAALGNQNVYAINSEALTGGAAQTTKILSQDDLDKATADLTNNLAAQAEINLNNELVTGDIKVISSGLTKEVLAKTANKNVNDPVDSFDMTLIARITALTYHEQDVKSIIQEKIGTVLSDDKYIVPDAQTKLTTNFKALDLSNGKGILSAHYETVAAYKIDSGDLTKLLAGKDANSIKEILLSKPEIDRVDVQFSPFFVNKAPKLNGKIYIHKALSQSS